RGQLVEPAEKLEVVLDGLAEADARIETDELFGDALRDGKSKAFVEKPNHLGDDVVVAWIGLHRPRLALHVHQAEVGVVLSDDARELGSPRSAVTSFTSSAPSSRARAATSDFAVSIETGEPASASSTGTTRRSSSSAETGSAPGRVDSPPMSTIAAPSASNRIAESAASPGSKLTPPSENESGVTLTTPITDGRGKRSSRGSSMRGA